MSENRMGNHSEWFPMGEDKFVPSMVEPTCLHIWKSVYIGELDQDIMGNSIDFEVYKCQYCGEEEIREID